MSSIFWSVSRLRLWLACVALFAALSLGAWSMYLFELEAMARKGGYEFSWPVHVAGFVLDLPGLYGTMVFGASPHGGSFGDWRDVVIIPAISGLFWGTASWASILMLRAIVRRRSAADVA